MGAGSYAVGCLVLAGFGAPLLFAAVRIRRALLVDWPLAWSCLVDAIVVAALVTVVGELLGAVGQLRRVPLVAAALVVAAVGWRLPPRSPNGPWPGYRPSHPPRSWDRWATVGALLAACGVGAQWLAWTAQASGRGMTAYDTLFYHGPVAARFAQTSSIASLHDIVPGEAVTFHPMTTELWHAIGIVAFHADIASLVGNLAALGVAFLAAWCVAGRAGLCGMAFVCTVPYQAITQPGSSFNDIPALAAFCAAVALSSQVRRDPRFAALSGLAAGLAAGIKLSFLGPAALMWVALVVLTPRGRRTRTALTVLALELVAGGAWYLRNLLIVGNPLPALHFGLPAPRLPVDDRYGASLAGTFDAARWATVYHQGLNDYFGRAWPAAIVMVVAAVGLGLAGRDPWARAMALLVLASLAVYAITPTSGDPLFFRFNLRYTVGLQGVAVFVVASTGVAWRPWAQRGLCALGLLVVVLAWPGPPTGRHDPYQQGAWPDGHRLAAITVVVAVVGLWMVWRTASSYAGRLRPAVSASPLLWIVVATVGILIAGSGVDQRFESARYRHAEGTLAPAWAWAQGVRHQRIGVVGLYQQYPFAGPDLSNHVQYVGVRTAHHGFARAPTCSSFRRALDAGTYRYIVTSSEGIEAPAVAPPESAWVRGDRHARQILAQGVTSVFELSGPLDPAAC
ncbi:MAG: hypothetical protein NVS3B12_14620 [Acidimicrobiales bacterium]